MMVIMVVLLLMMVVVPGRGRCGGGSPDQILRLEPSKIDSLTQS